MYIINDHTVLQTYLDQVISVLWRPQTVEKGPSGQSMRLEAHGFAGNLLQRIIVISLFNSQLKISIHLVISLFTRPCRNLLHREKSSIFCSSCTSYPLYGGVEWTAVNADGKLRGEKEALFYFKQLEFYFVVRGKSGKSQGILFGQECGHPVNCDTIFRTYADLLSTGPLQSKSGKFRQ